ncbi:hypothetical protein PAECIP111893_03707 [Paenibacillus plantiphilus]|uniref:Uncharacterized protein n=1 Tax=Paenibacillus plantiphilus TaxID=2905650 RepID=A0ABN8GNE9_9BACL|nr:hypothetical protein PAECIP111893_03707 [Paenibacillus plantiphilus]
MGIQRMDSSCSCTKVVIICMECGASMQETTVSGKSLLKAAERNAIGRISGKNRFTALASE